MKYKRRWMLVAALILSAAGTACGDFGDGDLETEVGNEPNNGGGPGELPEDGFQESVRVAVGAKHLVTAKDGTEFATLEVTNREVMTVIEDTRGDTTVEIECSADGASTLEIRLTSVEDASARSDGTLNVDCIDPETISFSPNGYTVFSPTRRAAYTDRLVTTQPQFSVRYDPIAGGDRLAGYAYGPFSSVVGLEYRSRPDQLTAAGSNQGRFIEISVSPDADNPAVDTVLGESMPVEVIDPSDAEEVRFYDVSGEPVDSGDELAGEILQAEAFWQSEPVFGPGFEFESLTPDTCEVDSVGAVTEEEGDDQMPVFITTVVGDGTCEIEATVVDGGGVSETLTFEVVE
jgi:hypothetical protein